MGYGQFDGCSCCEGTISAGTCTCTLSADGWVKSLAESEWTFTNLQFSNNALTLTSNLTNGQAYVEQSLNTLIPDNKYTVLVPFSSAQWDYNLWIDIDGHEAFSPNGLVWFWDSADNDFFCTDSQLCFVAESTSHTIQIGFTDATSISDPDFHTVSGLTGSGNAIKEICLCAPCAISMTGVCDITFRAAGTLSEEAGRIEWEIIFCSLYNEQSGDPLCNPENQAGFSIRTATGPEITLQVQQTEPSGTYQVTMDIYDDLDNLICRARKQFQAGWCGTCCNLGVPTEVLVETTNLDTYDPFNTQDQGDDYPVVEDLRIDKTYTLAFFSTGLDIFGSVFYRYISPDIYSYTDFNPNPGAGWFRRWYVFSAEIQCAGSPRSGIVRIRLASITSEFEANEEDLPGMTAFEYSRATNRFPTADGSDRVQLFLRSWEPGGTLLDLDCTTLTNSFTFSPASPAIWDWDQGTIDISMQ